MNLKNPEVIWKRKRQRGAVGIPQGTSNDGSTITKTNKIHQCMLYKTTEELLIF